jgi:hypothetical protein
MPSISPEDAGNAYESNLCFRDNFIRCVAGGTRHLCAEEAVEEGDDRSSRAHARNWYGAAPTPSPKHT